MNPETEEIFLEALDLLGKEREDFLRSSCAGRADLRAEVDRLLEYASKAEEFFGEASTVMGHLSHRRSFGVEKLGDQIGNYKLVERLGEGGFGVVWRGSQTHPIKREVAIKVIKAGMDTREVLTSFEGEREALSRMDHPNIARVLDAVETESCRPYVVMELVRGESITKFCDATALPLEERLRIFLEICHAISHAHQKGVIHRDIKPSNILVTQEGRSVKVIDFGIAKAIEGRLTDQTMMTMGEQLMGTPTYMSPEQVGYGVDLDTRTDIYALGTLLYELMIGVTPFDRKVLTSKGQEGMRQMILEVEPNRPSVRFSALAPQDQQQIAKVRDATPEQLKHFVFSDLDWIVMKALEKSPDRRYATADALAADLEHFLNNEPVSARAPSNGYLISKFVSRHRKTVILTLGVAVVLIVTTAVSIFQAVRATKAEGRAKTLLNDSQSVSSLLVDVFKLPDPEANGRNITLAEALRSAAQKLEKMDGLQPERKALLQSALASSYEGLGLYPEATELLKKALKSDETVLGRLNPTTLQVQGHLVRLLFDCGYYNEAWELGKSEVERRKKANGPNAPDTLKAEMLLEKSTIRCGKKQRGTPTLQPTQESRPSDLPRDVEKQREAILRILGEKESHLAELRKSHRPDDTEVLQAMNHLAEAYEACVYRDKAVAIQSELVDLIRAKYGETHHLTLENEEALSYYLWRAGHWKEALDLREKTIAKQRKVYGPEHPETLAAEAWLIEQVYHSGDTQKTVTVSREIVPVLERVEGPKNRNTLNAKSFLARALMSQGQSKESLEILEQIAPLMSDDTYVNLALANLEVWFGQKDRYEQTRKRMLDFCVKERDGLISRPDILERAMLICCLQPLKDETQKQELLKTIDRCQEIRKSHDRPHITETEEAWRKFLTGMVLFRAGEYQTAIAAFEVAQKMDSVAKKTPPETPLAAIYEAQCRQQLGEKLPDMSPLFAAADARFGLPSSQEEPMQGLRSADATPLTRWNLLREAKEILKPK